MSKIVWVQAHPRRLPDKVNTPPHVELFAAHQKDQINKEIEQIIAAELDRDFRRASNGAP